MEIFREFEKRDFGSAKDFGLSYRIFVNRKALSKHPCQTFRNAIPTAQKKDLFALHEKNFTKSKKNIKKLHKIPLQNRYKNRYKTVIKPLQNRYKIQ